MLYNLDSMRRRQGNLLYFEQAILDVAKWCRENSDGDGQFYAAQPSFRFKLALKLADRDGQCVPSDLTKKGTLYRALNRLEKMGYLESQWEDSIPIGESRPRRRYYKLTLSLPLSLSK